MPGVALRALRRSALLGMVLTLVATGSAHAASFFSPTGPWNAPIPANPPLEPNSALIVANISTAAANAGSGNLPSINTDSYSTTLYDVSPSTPLQQITIDSSSSPEMNALRRVIAANGGVPIPANAEPAPGSDGHVLIYDGTSRKLYEFWHFSTPDMNAPGCIGNLPWKNPTPCWRDGAWHAEGGGIMDNVDTDPGYFSTTSWPGLTPDDHAWKWGATATSLPLAGGLITFDDLNSGVIPHALAGAFMKSCQDHYVFPAQRRDGTGNDLNALNCVPEGAKIQLDPAYNVGADSNPPLTKAIERAAQTYGIIIRDRTGGTFSFYGQDPQTEPTNPYTSGPGVGGLNNGGLGYFGGLKPWDLFRNFPWSRLRVLQGTHCTDTNSPCG